MPERSVINNRSLLLVPRMSICTVRVKMLSFQRNGKESKMDAGDRFNLPTSKGEVIIIKPWDMARRTFD
jgi:hypothetical protein